ncbi:MAG: integrase arm-type DNA-binding domain-containing protein [Pseudomonadota bacterium]
MPRKLHCLTALKVAKLARPGLYGDGGGLTLQITKQGSKSWLFRYMVDGNPHGMGLGPAHTVSLADARQKAQEARKQLTEGINPLAAKREAALAAELAKGRVMTFDKCAEAYIQAHQISWKNAKHTEQWRSTLRKYVSPVIGNFAVGDIDTVHVMECLTPIWGSKTETASRVRGRIESILDWASTCRYRSGENPARWKGHLENLLANISKTARTRHFPSLPWPYVNAFIRALRTQQGISPLAMEFLILTACRSGEVRIAEWSEFDLPNRVWTIPAARMKAKREHQVPLSDQAIALLKRVPQIVKSRFVFAGTKNQGLSDMALIALLRGMNEDEPPAWVDSNGDRVTVHGFRSTFRMWAAETTNFPREVAEHALAHQLPDAVERAYQRSSLFAKRIEMMQQWAEFCLRD